MTRKFVDKARPSYLSRKHERGLLVLPELEEIKERRRALRLSQRQLAGQVGVSQSTVAKIESGRISPHYSVVKKVFAALESAQAKSMGKASEVATSPVMSVDRKDSVLHAIKIFQQTGFKQIPVREGEVWVGCVYERTITRHMTQTKDPKEILRMKVGAVMDDALPTVGEETPIATVIPLLQVTQAVLITKHGRVTGIATNADLLKFIRSDSGRFIVKGADRMR